MLKKTAAFFLLASLLCCSKKENNNTTDPIIEEQILISEEVTPEVNVPYIIYYNQEDLIQQLDEVVVIPNSKIPTEAIEKIYEFASDGNSVKVSFKIRENFKDKYQIPSGAFIIIDTGRFLDVLGRALQTPSFNTTYSQFRAMERTLLDGLPGYALSLKDTIEIPITFYILIGAKVNISSIEKVVSQLNSNFSNAKIQFKIKDINLGNYSLGLLNNISPQDADLYPYDISSLNIYVADIVGEYAKAAEGVGNFPVKTANTNRLLIRSKYLDIDENKDLFVLTHELGHVFSLYHDYENVGWHEVTYDESISCNAQGDGICDTYTPEMDFEELEGFYSELDCNNPSVRNFMGYSHINENLRTCNNGIFTLRQNTRIRFVAEEYMNEIICSNDMQDVDAVHLPSPNDLATEVPLNGTFSFTPGANTPSDVSYKIFTGKTQNLTSFIESSNTENAYSNLDSGTKYYWKVETLSNTGEVLASSPIWNFTTVNQQSIGQHTNPLPELNAVNVPINGTFSFTPGANTPSDVSYKIFTGKTQNLTSFIESSNTENAYSNLDSGTKYYWKVETLSNTGEVLASSPIWSFTTISNTVITDPVFNQTPTNTETNIALAGNLSFTAGANTPANATFRLYFDNNVIPIDQFDLGNQTSHTYTNLQENSTYYWFVETLNNSGTVIASSNVLSFITEEYDCVFVGDVVLETQQEINNFGAQNYCEITGDLTIGRIFGNTIPTDISDLTSLSNINKLGGNLRISSNPNLTSLGSGLLNLELKELNLQGSSNELQIHNNANLTDLSGFGNVSIYSLNLNNNQSLTSLSGIETVLIKGLSINNCNSLTSFIGINNSITTLDVLSVSNSNEINTLSGLDDVTVTVVLSILGNSSLNNFCAINLLSGNAAIVNILDNAYNPTKQDILNGNCSE